MKQFELPENWWVRTDEQNYLHLAQWRGICAEYIRRDYLVGMCVDNNGKVEKGHNPVNCVKSSGYDFGKEITFEQFMEFVQNQKPIGWKLKEEFKPVEKKILAAANCESCGWCTNTTYDLTLDCDAIKYLNALGTLELWFYPVYNINVVTIAGYSVEKKGENVAFGCQSFTKAEVEGVLALFDRSELEFECTIRGEKVEKAIIENVLKLF